MNPTLFASVLRQRLSSKVRLALLFCIFTLPLMVSLVIHGIGVQAVAWTGGAYALILGAGVLGMETSSGVMQLLFARPVRRWEYVTSRWLGVACGASALAVVQLLCAWAIWTSQGTSPASTEVALIAAQLVINAFGTASVVLMFSSFVSGVGDVVALFLTQITGQMVGMVGQFRQSPAMIRTGEEISRFIGATVPLASFTSGHQVAWFELVSYLSTISICVVVAVVMLNRREISYASE